MTDTGTRTQAKYELDHAKYSVDEDPIGWCRRIRSLAQRAYPTGGGPEFIAGFLIRTFPDDMRRQFSVLRMDDTDPKVQISWSPNIITGRSAVDSRTGAVLVVNIDIRHLEESSPKIREVRSPRKTEIKDQMGEERRVLPLVSKAISRKSVHVNPQMETMRKNLVRQKINKLRARR